LGTTILGDARDKKYATHTQAAHNCDCREHIGAAAKKPFLAGLGGGQAQPQANERSYD
jgi:hypothetical protein